MKDLYKKDSLSDTAQETAIRHGAGPCAVIAGPGSGKTRVLTRRIRCLIEDRGIPASSILVLTFSRAAAANMRSRFLRESGSAAAASGVIFGTFHSFFYRILQLSSQEHLRLISPSSKRAYLQHLCDLGPDLTERMAAERSVHMPDRTTFPAFSGAPGRMPDRTGPEDLQLLISRFKNGLPCRQPWLAALVEEYDRYLQSRGWIDFDDMILCCRDLLRQDPAVLEDWRRRCQWILVDEFQDVSLAQYEVLLLLAAPRNNLFVVGDDDQSIYGFRGAAPGTLRKFLYDFSLELPDVCFTDPSCPGQPPQASPLRRSPDREERSADSRPGLSRAKDSPGRRPGGIRPAAFPNPDAGVVFLTSNYRCGKAILDASAALIRDNTDRIDKRFVSRSGRSGTFACRTFTEKEEEYAFLARRLESLSAQERSRTAVIFRTHAGARGFLDSPFARGIPFLAEGAGRRKQASTDHEIILGDLLAYYRSAALLAGSAQMTAAGKKDLLRIMNRPDRFLSGSFLSDSFSWGSFSPTACPDQEAPAVHAGFEYAAVREFLQDLALLDLLPPAYSMRYLLDSMGYRSCAEKTGPDSGPFLDSLLEKAGQFPSVSSWIAYLAELLQTGSPAVRSDRAHTAFSSTGPGAAEGSDHQTGRETVTFFQSDGSLDRRSAADRAGGVHVLTMHACKGLEFDTVLIPDLNEGNVPSRRALSLQEIEEERRLLYVAMTRARCSLTLTWLEGTADRPATPSRFLHRFL